MPAEITPVEQAFRPAFARYLRLLAWVTGSGILTGVLVFGVGGRIAMRVLALTSSDAVQGAFTDDGEEIGEVSLGGTIGLVVFGGVFGGVVGGLAYGLIRAFLPTDAAWRRRACALIGAGVGTQLFVNPGDRDFSILDPLWLVVALFVALSTLYGILIPTVAERLRGFYESAPLRLPHLLAFAPLAFLVLAPPFLLGGLLVGVVYTRLVGRERPAWVTVAGRAVLTFVVLYAAVAGVSEIADVEGRDPRPSDFVEPEF